MRKRSAILIATLAVVGGMAGCGGGGSDELSADEYSQKLEDVLTPLGSSLQQLGSEASASTSKDELGKAIQGGEDAVQSALDDLDGVEPPSEASDANDELKSALSDYEDSLQETDDVVANGSDQEIAAQVQQFKTDSATFVSTLAQIQQELDDAGVSVGTSTSGG